MGDEGRGGYERQKKGEMGNAKEKLTVKKKLVSPASVAMFYFVLSDVGSEAGGERGEVSIRVEQRAAPGSG